MPRQAKKISVEFIGKPFMGDLLAALIAERLATRQTLTLAASDGQLVDKKQTRKRS